VKASEKLPVWEEGGRGDREREVEREVWPDGGGRIGICIVLESRRAARLVWAFSEVTGGLPTIVLCRRELPSVAEGIGNACRREGAGLDDSVEALCREAEERKSLTNSIGKEAM
jgi:hypothetical protein